MLDRSLTLKIIFGLMALWGAAGVQAKSCRIEGAGMAFGAYNTANAAPLDSVGSIRLDCTGSFRGVLSLSAGSTAGASFSGGRRMVRAGGTGVLVYNLYANASRTQVLGDGTGGSRTLTVIGRNNHTQAVWGRISGGQRSLQAGSYSDTVVVTVSY